MGSLHSLQLNTIIFGEIKDKSQLEAIKLNTRTSGLLFKALTEEQRYPYAYNLTISLPHHDEHFKAYGSFEHLFTQDRYLNWKKMITALFPDLSNQFTGAEKEAKNHQELERLERQLEHYIQKHGFYRDDGLPQRITELRRELVQESDSEDRNGFDFQ